MRILLVTDAWDPQVNGVVRTMKRVITECEDMGHIWHVISPNDGFRTIPLPTYSEIRLALNAEKKIEARFLEFQPDAVHIATEGTLGWAARSICLKHRFPYTTSYHTRFPEYVSARFPLVPVGLGYAFVREFHKYSGRVMVATNSMRDELADRGFKNIAAWSRGVDTDLFHPSKRRPEGLLKGASGPVWLYVGRVAVEKNIAAFLDVDLEGTKVVVGDGPQLETLRAKHPEAVFLGARFGEELAECYASADVFVFPSLTDTFGLVILEAMAAGTPVAAFNAPGPRDLIPGSGAGSVSDDLQTACREALAMSRTTTRAYAETYSWRACSEQFINNLEPLPVPERMRFWKRIARLRNIRIRRRKTADAAGKPAD